MPTQPTLDGLYNRFVHLVAAQNQIPDGSFADLENVIWLPWDSALNRASNIQVPLTVVSSLNSSSMVWSPTTVLATSGHAGAWVAKPGGGVTQVNEIVRQINQRCLGIADPVTNSVVQRVEMNDREFGAMRVYTPGSTDPLSINNFPLYVDPDHDGLLEAVPFVIYVNSSFVPNPSTDGGLVLVRLNNAGLDESSRPW